MTTIISRARNYVRSFFKTAVQARFDITRTSHENKNHWSDADALSGRAAYFKSERKIARERSRMEAANNSWYSGMLRTAANHIIGTGPRLQILTTDPVVNQRIERAWRRWVRLTGFNQKLKTIIETYWRDGEVFGMRAMRPALEPISLDIRIYEPDQVAQPYWHILDPSLEDGKRVDNLGNPIEYWIYDHHPGDLNIGHVNLLAGDWYRADDVFHLFRAERPGQLRGFPRCAPAIDWLAHLRRFAKATLSAAESAALWGVFIKTTSSQLAPAASPRDFITMDFERNCMNFLPEGWEPQQLKPEHPATSNESFQKTELTYFARCANMPYSLAAGTSRDSNFASAKMDIKNLWQPEVESEQDATEVIVLETVFRWWLEEAVFAEGVLDGAPPIDQIEHQWHWPPIPQADETDVATAAATRMSTGQSTPSREASLMGWDWETEAKRAAADLGISTEEYKHRLADKLFGAVETAAPSGPTPTPKTQTDSAGTFPNPAPIGTP
jgi:lambda family phage portal protein